MLLPQFSSAEIGRLPLSWTLRHPFGCVGLQSAAVCEESPLARLVPSWTLPRTKDSAICLCRHCGLLAAELDTSSLRSGSVMVCSGGSRSQSISMVPRRPCISASARGGFRDSRARALATGCSLSIGCGPGRAPIVCSAAGGGAMRARGAHIVAALLAGAAADMPRRLRVVNRSGALARLRCFFRGCRWASEDGVVAAEVLHRQIRTTLVSGAHLHVSLCECLWSRWILHGNPPINLERYRED